MMRKQLVLLVLLSLILVSCEIHRKFNVEVLDDFCDELAENYDFIEKTKVSRSQGHINVYVHFSSEEYDVFDTSIYNDIEAFFRRKDIQEELLKEYFHLEDLSDGDTSDYPSIKVEFVDKVDIDSHFIKSPTRRINFYRDYLDVNRYQDWHEPFYYRDYE